MKLRICLLLLPICVAAAADKKLAREIYQELIETNTSFTTGATTPAAEAIARRFKAEGLPESDIHVLGAAPKKMNVVVRYRGTGKNKPILLLAHLDVVEALRSDWTIDPFKLNEKDGFFYGRGAGDDKAQAAIWTANLIQMKRDGVRPSRDIILALTADEEGGGPYNGVDWLLKNRRDLIDAEFCLNEGGWGDMKNGKPVMNSIQIAEKHSASFRIEVKNPGGHSSMPVKENAIYRLALALGRISQYDFPVRLNDATRNYFERLANVQTGQLAADMRAMGAGDAAAAARVAAASPYWNSTMRTTCVATRLDGGHAENALPQTAGALINCRILPDTSVEEVQATLQKVMADDNVSIAATNVHEVSPVSPLRPDVIKAVEQGTTEQWPGTPVIPIMVTGGTDGRFLRKEGIPTYGVMGLMLDPGDMRFHGRDERIPVKSFYDAQAFLEKLVQRLTE